MQFSVSGFGRVVAVAMVAMVAGGLVAMSGCGSSGGGSVTTPPVGTAAKMFFVESEDGTKVFGYSASATAQTAPVTTVTLPGGFTSYTLAADSAGNLYVGGYKQGAPYGGLVYVYAAGATGTATPTRTINGCTSACTTSFQEVDGMAIDGSGNLYVGDEDTAAIYEFSTTADGAATPTRTITATSATQSALNDLAGLAVDGSGNLYVDVFDNIAGAILVYAPTATGAATPTRTIQGSSPGLQYSASISVDASGNIYVPSLASSSSGSTSTIAVFGPTQNGNVAPVRTLNLPATYITNNAGAAAVDAVGNLYVLIQSQTNEDNTTAQVAVEVFQASGSGAVTPTSTLVTLAYAGGQQGPQVQDFGTFAIY